MKYRQASDGRRVAVVMAGGTGERFWPVSRSSRPKQLLCLTNPDTSLLAEAVARLETLVAPDDVFIATGRQFKSLVLQAGLPVPDENILAEPCRRNTSGCLFYVVACMLARFNDEELCLAVVTADHDIRDHAHFRRNLAVAFDTAEQSDSLVVVGIPPTRPETGYGYLETDAAAQTGAVLPVVRFVEKPGAEVAAALFESGRVLWNSGMFFWRIKVFMAELSRVRPQAADAVYAMAAALRLGDDAEMERIFNALPDVSIDHALMEHAAKVLVVPGDFHWDDVGAWDAVERNFPRDANGNVAVGDPILIDVENSIVYNDAGATNMAVGVIGVSNLVVVTTPDGVLVVTKDRVQDVRRIASMMKKRELETDSTNKERAR